MSDFLEALGLACWVTAAFLVNVLLGLVVVGAALLFVGYALSRR